MAPTLSECGWAERARRRAGIFWGGGTIVRVERDTLSRGTDEPAAVAKEAAVLLVGPNTEEAEDFAATVAGHGIALKDAGELAAPAPLVVLITDPDARDVPPELLADREVLPVTFPDEFTAVLTTLSHLAPRVQGTGAAAAQLAKTIRVGGEALRAWEALLTRADAWEAGDEGSRLLSEAEQARAVSLLAAPPAHLDAELVERASSYTAASQVQSVRRRRRWRLGIGTACLILLLVTVLAGVQSYRAAVAARVSEAAADAAAGRRLASEAFAVQGRDPDVPLVLADLASGMTDDPDVRRAVAGIVGGEMPHVSIPLDTAPRQLSASASGRFAYSSFEDMEVRVLDPEGAEVARFAYADGEYRGAQIALSPDGERVAVLSGDEVPRVFQVATGEGEAVVGGWDDESDSLLGWLDDRLLVGSAEGVALAGVEGERELLLATPARTEPITRAALSPDASVMAVTDGLTVQVWDVAGRRLLNSAELDHVTDLAVNDAGSVVFAARYPAVTRIDFAEEAEVAPDTRDRASVGVQTLADGFFAASDRRGTITLYQEASGVEAIARFRAHQDDIVRIAVDPRGTRLWSVSLDGYLRVWDLSDLSLSGQYTVAGPVQQGVVAGVLDFSAALDSVFPGPTIGNQLRVAAPGVLAVALPSRGAALTDVDVVAETHESIGLPGIGIPGRALLTPGGTHVVRAMYDESTQDFVVELWRIDEDGHGWGEEPVWSATPGLAGGLLGPSPFLVDVAADGNVLLASGVELTQYDPAGEVLGMGQAYSRPASPIAVASIFGGASATVTSDGVLHRLGRPEVDLKRLIPEGQGAELTAAQFDGDRLWLLTSSGAILCVVGGEADVLLPAGLVTGSGALRLSPDGAMLAHVGASVVTVLDTSDGAVLGTQRTPLGNRIDDVAFAPGLDALHVVNKAGAVATWVLADMSAEPVSAPPRSLTTEELVLFNLTERADG